MITTETTTQDLHLQIMEIVCDCCLVKMEDLKSPLRISRELCDARAIAMTLIYKHCSEQTLKKIGTLFGGRDHSTIITALRKTSDLCDSNFDFRRMFNCSESVVKNLLEDKYD